MIFLRRVRLKECRLNANWWLKTMIEHGTGSGDKGLKMCDILEGFLSFSLDDQLVFGWLLENKILCASVLYLNCHHDFYHEVERGIICSKSSGSVCVSMWGLLINLPIIMNKKTIIFYIHFQYFPFIVVSLMTLYLLCRVLKYRRSIKKHLWKEQILS